MTRSPTGRARTARLVAALVAAAVVASVALVGGVAAAGGVATADAAVTPHDDAALATSDGVAAGSVGPLTECFVGEGYPLRIGEPPTAIESVVHLSVLTDPSAGTEFGVELAGTVGDDRIVTLAAGVRLNRIGLIETGTNPFAAFDVLYAFELSLPMFDGAIDESTYADEGSPISGAAGVVPC
ncbi:hypothetical protein GRS48_13115 [Halorubrum sp. JWXQ-INN 858]|uniref:DUF7332 family protein n=1 Tax=Halorubrum sp. JWXQ-INN 858 TaxID=2690782 RepID=UPI00135A2281|nr:hypothetical protein [Halorubrum sp. JWXQ-INN 858]MWV65753.1 hypothetical protein [Halorubrum sp. JWXQ-INN 858]